MTMQLVTLMHIVEGFAVAFELHTHSDIFISDLFVLDATIMGLIMDNVSKIIGRDEEVSCLIIDSSP